VTYAGIHHTTILSSPSKILRVVSNSLAPLFPCRYAAKMPCALFVGEPENLPRAFPPDLREEIASKVTILPGEFQKEGWRDHLESLAQAEILFSTWGMPRLDTDFLAAAPCLKAVFYAAGSIKYFATPESYARGILTSSALEANAIPVAEFTHSLIVLSLKRFWAFVRQPPERRFERGEVEFPGAYRASVGLLSLGAIGRSVAGRLQASNEIRVIAHDPFANPEAAAQLGVTLVSLEELFATSDVLSIHAPWLLETEGMVNGHLVRSMKPGATLINTARGAVINEVELVASLRSRPDLTALLDVTHPEPPLPDSPLRTLDNVILTPHIAGSLGGEITRMGRWMVDEMHRYLDGEPLRHVISEQMLARMA
jgi:phosphoglycerate dehydrogenase-like enzyme